MDGNNPDRSDLLGKIEGNHWSGGDIPGVSWTYSDQKTITIVFGDDFDSSVYQISDIIVAGGDAHSVCSFGYYFEAGDSVTISTIGLLLNNGGNPPDISHVTLYRGDGGPRPDDEPLPARLVVTKKIAVDGNLADATPASGWVFDAATTSDGASLDSSSGTTTDPDGSTEFAVDFDSADDAAQVTITERQQAGYALLQQDSDNAVCTVGTDATRLEITDSGALGFTADVHPGDVVSCTVINQEDLVAEDEPASIDVTKMVVPSGGNVNDAAPASGWVFDATTTSEGAALSDTTGTTADPDGSVEFTVAFDAELDPDGSADVTITENQQAGYTLLQQGGNNAVCTVGTGSTPLQIVGTGALGFTAEVHPGDDVSCIVINQEDQGAFPEPPLPVEITMTKQVLYTGAAGTVPGEGWTFDATTSTADASMAGDTATTGNDGTAHFEMDFDSEFTPDGTASLTVAEEQQTGFTLDQHDHENAVCTVDPAQGAEEPGDVDNAGALGFSIEVHPGDEVSCTVVNRQLAVLENPGPSDTPTDTPAVGATGTPTAGATVQSQVLASSPGVVYAASGTDLAQTGTNTRTVLIVLGAILLLGTGLTLVARRRKVS